MELAAERAKRLPSAQQNVAEGGRLTRKDLAGYDKAKVRLYVSQHRKCAYCEDGTKMLYEPVEHFRPALRAIRGPSFSDGGYWWLAWTWENLLFACSICNSSFKKDRFPLEDGSPVMVPMDALPCPEHAVLVDPADPLDVDPLDLIVSAGRLALGSDGARRRRPRSRDRRAPRVERCGAPRSLQGSRR